MKAVLGFKTSGSIKCYPDGEHEGLLTVDTTPFEAVFLDYDADLRLVILVQRDDLYERAMNYITENELIKEEMCWEDLHKPGLFFDSGKIVIHVQL